MGTNQPTEYTEAQVKSIVMQKGFPEYWSTYWRLRTEGMWIVKAILFMHSVQTQSDWDYMSPVKARHYECVYMELMREREAKRQEVMKNDAIEAESERWYLSFFE